MCLCVCIYTDGWKCAWVYACTYAPAWHTGAFHVECMQQPMSKEPHAHLPSCSCRARGPGPHSKRHLSIQPILCNKCQQLTELHTTPSLLLLCYHPSPLQLQPSNSASGHNPGCRREVCPLRDASLPAPAGQQWGMRGTGYTGPPSISYCRRWKQTDPCRSGHRRLLAKNGRAQQSQPASPCRQQTQQDSFASNFCCDGPVNN